MASKDYAGSAAWTSASTNYTTNVQRTSAEATPRLVELLDAASPLDGSSTVIEVGAGAGALTSSIASKHPLATILATDISEGMLSLLDAKGYPNVSTRVLDGRELSQHLTPGSFSHACTSFMLQFIPDPQEVVEEMLKVLAPGGVVGIGIWGRRLDPYFIWKKACLRLDPGYAPGPDFYDEDSWYSREDVEQALKRAGCVDVEGEDLTMSFPWPNSEKFAEFFFDSGNPSLERMKSYWKGDMGAVRKEVVRIVDEEYGGGTAIQTSAVLAVGRKVQ